MSAVTARERLMAVQRACPAGHDVHVRDIGKLSDLQPGDIVLGHRPDNGEHRQRRVRAAVTIARYVAQ